MVVSLGAYATLPAYEEPTRGREESQDPLLKKFMHGWHNVNVSGDYISNSKNVRHSFIAGALEDSKYCSLVTETLDGKLTDSYDFTTYGVYSSLLCDVLQSGDRTSNIRYSWWVITNAMDVEYAMFIINSQHIFGSVGVRGKQYCILNTQYTKEEYEMLREKIIQQMNETPYIDKRGTAYRYGEFFPLELSPFAYNETTAYESFSLSKEQASAKGYVWRDPAPRGNKPSITAENLARTINEVDDAILDEIIGCLHKGTCGHNCTVAYKIILQELVFYRQMQIPLPQLCPNCRHAARILHRNPFMLWKRACQCAGQGNDNAVYQNSASHFHGASHCPNEFETSFAPGRPEIVYCEQCYQSEIT